MLNEIKKKKLKFYLLYIQFQKYDVEKLVVFHKVNYILIINYYYADIKTKL